ncbi:MAG: DNA methyltransferase [Erythrobacter sp.]
MSHLRAVDALRDCSRSGEIVLDDFGGSGSTLIAAQKTWRKARLIEYDPRYCDTIMKRWEACTGKKSKLDACGSTFEEGANRRPVLEMEAAEPPGRTRKLRTTKVGMTARLSPTPLATASHLSSIGSRKVNQAIPKSGARDHHMWGRLVQ